MASFTAANVEHDIGALSHSDFSQSVGQRFESARGQKSTSRIHHLFGVTQSSAATLTGGNKVDVALSGHIEAMA